jgi:hypothetical protein
LFAFEFPIEKLQRDCGVADQAGLDGTAQADALGVTIDLNAPGLVAIREQTQPAEAIDCSLPEFCAAGSDSR